jgi:hypothetical protein
VRSNAPNCEQKKNGLIDTQAAAISSLKTNILYLNQFIKNKFYRQIAFAVNLCDYFISYFSASFYQVEVADN